MNKDIEPTDAGRRGAQGISNRESPQEEAEEREVYSPIQETAPPAQDAAGNTSEPSLDPAPDEQTSLKAGARSAAQKVAGTRHPDGPMPATQKVAGAFGREGDVRESEDDE